MRPVRKGASPVVGDFNKYEDAKPDLVAKLGLYCSYCERKVPTLLAVEHIEPKSGEYGQAHLEKKWSNFLLACTNCNSCKGSKEIDLKRLFFPDRDNTFHAFTYTDDGKIECSPQLSANKQVLAKNTLKLVGLDKASVNSTDSNEQLIALDRVSQRMETLIKAQNAELMLQQQPQNELLKDMAVEWAISEGFFSIWMKVFNGYPDMKIRLIRAFAGTEASGCFDMVTGDTITPAPNPDALNHGGKV